MGLRSKDATDKGILLDTPYLSPWSVTYTLVADGDDIVLNVDSPGSPEFPLIPIEHRPYTIEEAGESLVHSNLFYATGTAVSNEPEFPALLDVIQEWRAQEGLQYLIAEGFEDLAELLPNRTFSRSKYNYAIPFEDPAQLKDSPYLRFKDAPGPYGWELVLHGAEKSPITFVGWNDRIGLAKLVAEVKGGENNYELMLAMIDPDVSATRTQSCKFVTDLAGNIIDSAKVEPALVRATVDAHMLKEKYKRISFGVNQMRVLSPFTGDELVCGIEVSYTFPRIPAPTDGTLIAKIYKFLHIDYPLSEKIPANIWINLQKDVKKSGYSMPVLSFSSELDYDSYKAIIVKDETLFNNNRKLYDPNSIPQLKDAMTYSSYSFLRSKPTKSSKKKPKARAVMGASSK